MGLLANDCRMRSIDIAKEVELTSTSVINRINKLINSKIIQRYSTTFDTNKLGYKSFIVNLSLRNYDVKGKIIRYLSSIPFIWEIYKAIGGCDIEIALFTLNFEHFYLLMEELRNKFPDDITFYDYLHITDVHKMNYLPQS